MSAIDLACATLCMVFALALAPWRAAAPPWPALAWCALLPWFWTVDRLSAQPVLQPLAGFAS